MKPALVTGASGFLGWHVARVLLERGYRLRALVRPGSRVDALDVECVTGDLRDAASLERAVAGCGLLFHVAADYRLWARDPGELYRSNVDGTRNLLQAAQDAGVERVVYTSTVGCIGVPPGGVGDEQMPVALEDMAGDYKRSKFLAEQVALGFAHGGLDVVIVNPTVVFGPGDIYRQDNSIIMQVAQRKVKFLVEGGLNAVHIMDVVDGHMAALEHGRCGERYILGGENLTHLDLIRMIAGVVEAPAPILVIPGGVVRFLARPARLLQPFLNLPVSASDLHLAGYHFYFDTRKAHVELGLLPPRSVKEAIIEAYEWFKQPLGLISLPAKEKNFHNIR